MKHCNAPGWISQPRIGLVGGLVVTAMLAAAGPAAANPWVESQQLYATSRLLNFCADAQQIIANTELVAENIVHTGLGRAGSPFPPPGTPSTQFIASDALPYDGAEQLPLTTSQYIGFSRGFFGFEYAQSILCKMKSFDALDFYWPGSAFSGDQCSAINRHTAEQVIQSLSFRRNRLIEGLVFDDWTTHAGSQWSASSPAPVAYVSRGDGKLHLVSKQLYVPRDDPSPFVGPNKKGVHYCQLIAPAYLKRLLTGAVSAPSCDDFPVYTAPVFGPPEAPKRWDCHNP